MKLILIAVYLSELCGVTMAYLFGAPAAACSSMTPGHNVDPQTSDSPYRVRVSQSTYTEGDSLTITLGSSSGEKFGGFLLQARRTDPSLNTDEPIGTFNIPIASKRVSDCGRGIQAVTHTAGLNMKTTMTFRWRAPASTTGNVVFLATFAKNFTTFWVKVPSIEVQALLLSTTTMTIRPPSRTNFTVRPPSRTNFTMPMLPVDLTCGNEKSCFLDCVDDFCYTIVTWEVFEESKEIQFHMRTVVSGNTNQWMAVGFSHDIYMGDDSVVECASSGGNYKAYSSYNSNYKVNTRDMDSNAVTLQNASLAVDVFSCFVRRKLNVTGNGKAFDLRQKSKWLMLFAHGETSDDGVKKMHSWQSWDRPIVSTSKLNLDILQQIGWMAVSGVTRTVGSSFVLVSMLLTMIID